MADEMMKDKPAKKSVSVTDVLAKDKAPKPEAKKGPDKTGAAKKKHKHTHIEHHYDEKSGAPKGHTVRHTPMDGGSEVSYAAPDMDAVHDGLEEHVGEENAGEGAPEPAPDAAGAQAQPQAQPQPQAGM